MLGICTTQAVRVLLSSTSSRRTSIVDVKLVLTHFDFNETLSLSHCVLNELSRCKFCKNGFFNNFFPLSHTCHFETRPSPLSQIGENAFGTHFLQLYRKNEYGDSHFLFHDFNNDSPSFHEEKIGTNLSSVFWKFY